MERPDKSQQPGPFNDQGLEPWGADNEKVIRCNYNDFSIFRHWSLYREGLSLAEEKPAQAATEQTSAAAPATAGTVAAPAPVPTPVPKPDPSGINTGGAADVMGSRLMRPQTKI